jgi:hypothetical protein
VCGVKLPEAFVLFHGVGAPLRRALYDVDLRVRDSPPDLDAPIGQWDHQCEVKALLRHVWFVRADVVDNGSVPLIKVLPAHIAVQRGLGLVEGVRPVVPCAREREREIRREGEGE